MSDKFDDGNGNFGLICDPAKIGAEIGKPSNPHFKHSYLCLKCTSRWLANELIPCPVCGNRAELPEAKPRLNS